MTPFDYDVVRSHVVSEQDLKSWATAKEGGHCFSHGHLHHQGGCRLHTV